MPLDREIDTSDSSSEDVTDLDVAVEAEDSSSSQGEAPDSLLDRVSAAVGGVSDEDDDGDSASPAEKGEKSEQSEDAQGDEPEATDSDDQILALIEQLKANDVPLNKIERFRELAHENRQLKQERGNLTPALQKLQELSDSAQALGLDEQGLDGYLSALTVARTDPRAAAEKLQGIVQRLAVEAGDLLPNDLKARVDDGYLSEEDAKEITRLRAAQERSGREQQVREQLDEARASNEAANRVAEFQQHIIQTDPDYSPEKHSMVLERLAHLVATKGRPRRPEDALALAKEAYSSVNERLQKLIPKRPSVQEPTSARRRSASTTPPKTMLDAVTRALEA